MAYNRVYNFSPGPGILPEEVLVRIREQLLNYNNSGMGVMELSHRSKHYEEIQAEAEQLLRELIGIDENYWVLFSTGGATQQFSMIPMNLGQSDKAAAYLVSGFWAKRAVEEAAKFTNCYEAASTEHSGFRSVPRDFQLRPDTSYLHYTSNNTIFGTQYRDEPTVPVGIPLVCDASSDFLSRTIDVKKYALIYAAAQKNFGPAGVTVVILRKDLVRDNTASIPILMSYKTLVDNRSIYNTPPTFVIYVIKEMLHWMKSLGGVSAIAKTNREKAAIVYKVIDTSSFYRGHADVEHRSEMNLTFNLPTPELERRFIADAETAGLVGLPGYRAIGGIRASIYNAFPKSGCQKLADFMKEFEKKHG